jgi:zinc resistance-associated protein
MEEKMKLRIKVIMPLIVLAVVGFSTMAYAGWGPGYGPMIGPGGWGCGYNFSMMGPGGWSPDRHHMMRYYGYGQGSYPGNLPAEEIVKLDQQRVEFLKATENLRQQLYKKRLTLKNELTKKQPDTNKASKLQGEISKLQGTLDQKLLEYKIQVRKILPNYNRGYGSYDPMMGYGPHGGGYRRW